MKRKRILSWLTALTVMATMLMAVPLTANAADTDAYAEWVIYGTENMSTLVKAGKYYNAFDYSDSLTYVPTFTATGYDSSGNLKYSNGDLSFLVGDKSFTGYCGEVHTISAGSSTNALKTESATEVTIDTKFSSLSSEYESYDLMVVWVNCSSSKATAAGVTVTVGSNDAVNVSPTSSSSIDLQTYEATDLTADTITIKRYSAEGRLCYVGLNYNAPTTEAEFELSASTLTVPNGETKTITTKIGNITDPAYTWSSDNESVATVEDGVVTGVADGEATITCTVTGTNTATSEAVELSLTCAVTVESSKTISVTLGSGLSSATIGTQTIISSGTLTLNYGTYGVSVVNAAPVTFNSDSIVTSYTVAAGTGSTLDLSTTVNTVDDVSFPDEVYAAIEDATVIWGYDTAVRPDSFKYLNSMEKIGGTGLMPVAGAYSGTTTDSDVYAIVDLIASGSKIHATGSSVQFNVGTVINVPVVPGSVVSISNNNSGFTVSENGGDAGGEFKTSSSTYTYTYTGESNGYVSITGTVGFYIYYVKVTSGDSSNVKTVANGDFALDRTGSAGTYTVTDAYSDYQSVFGNTLSYIGNKKSEYTGYWTGTTRTATVNLTAQNSINKIYFVAQGGGASNIRLDLVDSEGNEIFTDVTPTQSEIIGYDGSTALYIYTYIVEGLTSGETYTLTYRNRDLTDEELEEASAVYVKIPDIYAAAMIGQAFGTGEADSGYYYENGDDQKIGVIRFLQSYAGDTPNSYGFYFVEEDGTIKSFLDDSGDAAVSGSATLTGGFYGDLTDIQSDETTNSYYAMPFVTHDGGTVYGNIISGSVDWDTEVTYPED